MLLGVEREVEFEAIRKSRIVSESLKGVNKSMGKCGKVVSYLSVGGFDKMLEFLKVKNDYYYARVNIQMIARVRKLHNNTSS